MVRKSKIINGIRIIDPSTIRLSKLSRAKWTNISIELAVQIIQQGALEKEQVLRQMQKHFGKKYEKQFRIIKNGIEKRLAKKQ